MAVFHSMQGRIQPMWPSPPLLWVLFLSMFFLLLVFFTLVPLFFFSVTSAQSQSSVTLCALVPCLDLSSLLALPYSQPSDSVKSGAWRCCLQTDHSYTSVFSVNSLLGIRIYISHCWVSVLSYKYKSIWNLGGRMPLPPGLHMLFIHISGTFPTHVPMAFNVTLLVFCVLLRLSLSKYFFFCFSWSMYMLPKNTHILIFLTRVHCGVCTAWDCRRKSHPLVLNASTDIQAVSVALLCIVPPRDNRANVVFSHSVVKKACRSCMISKTLPS